MEGGEIAGADVVTDGASVVADGVVEVEVTGALPAVCSVVGVGATLAGTDGVVESATVAGAGGTGSP